jgi:hypothetical protein
VKNNLKILLRYGNHKNWKLVESFSYNNEIELVKLLAESPDLIPAQDLREGAGELIAVVREVNVEIGFIDFLGFSAEGEIAVIECKLAYNPEMKRKVIGQVLQYGAALWGMSYEEFDQKIQDRAGKPLAELVQHEVNDPEWDEELFRSNIEVNLKEGIFILVIVVDEINDALTKIIRFLNACGSPNFSFAALEMRRFQSGDIEILLPKVDGDYRPPSQWASASRRMWDKELLLADAGEKLKPEAFDMLVDLLTFTEKHAPGGVGFGSGKEKGSFTYYCVRGNKRASIFSVYSNGDFSINLGAMPKIFSEEEIDAFKNQLAIIPPLQGITDSKKYWNTYKLGVAISEQQHLEMFKDCVLALHNNLQ